jgi:hypothetical protein
MTPAAQGATRLRGYIPETEAGAEAEAEAGAEAETGAEAEVEAETTVSLRAAC